MRVLFRSVQRVDVKLLDAAAQEVAAELNGDGDRHGEAHLAVLLEVGEEVDQPVRQGRLAALRHLARALEVHDRQDAGDDRRLDARRPRAVDEAQVGVGVEEELGDGAARAGIDLALQVVEVGGSIACLRSEEHTSELQSLMRISYAVFFLKHKITNTTK